jgi:hypothetical protein
MLPTGRRHQCNNVANKKPVMATTTATRMATDGNHQKKHYASYYLDIVSNCLEMYDLGITSMFSTLRR